MHYNIVSRGVSITFFHDIARYHPTATINFFLTKRVHSLLAGRRSVIICILSCLIFDAGRSVGKLSFSIQRTVINVVFGPRRMVKWKPSLLNGRKSGNYYSNQCVNDMRR